MLGDAGALTVSDEVGAGLEELGRMPPVEASEVVACCWGALTTPSGESYSPKPPLERSDRISGQAAAKSAANALCTLLIESSRLLVSPDAVKYVVSAAVI
jgi:hypothetical protein